MKQDKNTLEAFAYLGDAGFHSYFFGSQSVCDANVDDLRLEIVDTLGGVTLVPSHTKGFRAVFDTFFHKGIRQG